jgi:4-hydroxy-tetrahydrodipicolinate synthase
MFKGLYTALVTPFKGDDLTLDIKSFRDHVDWQIQEGVDGLVVLGTTGESPTLTYEEKATLIAECISVTNKRVPVIVGTGTNSTSSTIENSKFAKDKGADGVLIITPYYNKPTQDGLFEHYKAVNDNVGIPILLYNAPGRSVVNISNDTVSKLASLKNIVGIKDCAGAERALSLSYLTEKEDFVLLTGDDPDALAFNANGGVGCISVAGNILPQKLSEVQKLTRENDYHGAFAIFKDFSEIISLLFCETNPIPVKFALSKMGRCEERLRLPLTELKSHNKQLVEQTLKKLHLI